MYFQADDGVHGFVWISDGTEKRTYILNEIRRGKSSSFPSFMTVMPSSNVDNNPYLFFTATDGLYVSGSLNREGFGGS